MASVASLEEVLDKINDDPRNYINLIGNELIMDGWFTKEQLKLIVDAWVYNQNSEGGERSEP
jgi:hypothetical protein